MLACVVLKGQGDLPPLCYHPILIMKKLQKNKTTQPHNQLQIAKKRAIAFLLSVTCDQMWSRGHKARGQEHKKIRGQGQRHTFLGQTLSRPRTEMFEAKNQ